MKKSTQKAGAKAPARKAKTALTAQQVYLLAGNLLGERELAHANELVEKHGYTGMRWIIIPHPPTIVGLNSGRNLMWARRNWWNAIEYATMAAIYRRKEQNHAISTEPPSEYHVIWCYNRGVAPDDDNVWGRLKHVRDTMAKHWGIDDREMHAGRCRGEKDKALQGYCIIAF